MSFSGNSIISGISRTAAVTTNPAAALPKPVEAATSILGAAFQINCAKHFVLVITLSIKFLENMKQGFKRRVSLNKYRSEVTIPLRNNNFDYYAIDSTFRNINKLFGLFFSVGHFFSFKKLF